MLLLGSFFGTFDTTSVAFAEELGEPNIASGALMLSALVSIAIGFLFGTLRLAIGPTLAGIMIDLWGAQAGFIMGGVLALAIPVIALLHRRTIKTGRKSTVRRAKIKIPEAA